MSVEIEAKLKVDSLTKVEQKLHELGADFVAEQLQTDFLLDDIEDRLISNDQCLRIRRQVDGENEQCILCYKGSRQESEFKKRLELETEVKDYEPLIKLFSALGYNEKLVVEKKRRLWKLDGCEVALDELPLLGCFVEIEGPNIEKISDVRTRLELSKMPSIVDSYAKMIVEKHGRHIP
jgi:predicted adenylyl cyclase CyaB